MVAVLRSQLELSEPNELQQAQRPHLRLVEGTENVPALSPRPHGSLTYWRRRVVAASILVGLVWVISGSPLVSSGEGGTPPVAVQKVVESAAGDVLGGGRVVVVQPGDPLWSIARILQPSGDVRPLVDRIAELNDGHSLVAGQTLTLP